MSEPPHLILFPEVAYDEERFVEAVRDRVERYGNCVIVASEGNRRADGTFVAESGQMDDFGRARIGGVAPHLAEVVRGRPGYKFRYVAADYLRRAARHIAAAVDVDQARALGRAAAEMAMAGVHAKLPVIVRAADGPYRWEVGQVHLSAVANVERHLPPACVTEDGFHVTESCRRDLTPLILGEDPPLRGRPLHVRAAAAKRGAAQAAGVGGLTPASGPALSRPSGPGRRRSCQPGARAGPRRGRRRRSCR